MNANERAIDEAVAPLQSNPSPEQSTRPVEGRSLFAGVPMQLAFLFLAAALLFQDLLLPRVGLDPSWMLATQHGLLENIDFGRYLIISYGPLSVLTSRLFHPETWHLTVLFQIVCVFIALAPLVGKRWSPAFVLVLLVCVLANRIFYLNDGVVFAAAFSAFLLALLGRRTLALLSTAVLGVLALAKTSFFFAALPLFLLADLFGFVKKRTLPLQTVTLLVSMTVAFVMSGQDLASLPLYLRNGYEISKFYSGAMSLSLGPGGFLILLPFVACALALPILIVLRGRATPSRLVLYVVALGLAWLTLVIYKASFVRADPYHFYIGWNALLLIVPVMLFTARHMTEAPLKTERIDHALVVGMIALFLLTAEQRTFGGTIFGVPGQRIRDGAVNVVSLLGWMDPRKPSAYEGGRLAALNRMAVHLPIGKETIDVYPWDIGDVIAAGLNYQPRPSMQSYLAYSPYLQQLDLYHWKGPNAPDHVLFQLADIDGRLPTLALGPSIVEILSRYDAAGAVGERIHLRKRASPRAVSAQVQPARPLQLDEWITVPNEPARLTLASIRLKQTLLGSAWAFLDVPPELVIETKLASGEVRQYRFVASMSELGFAISPDLIPLLGAAGRAESDLPAGLQQSVPITAFRIRGGPMAAHSFAPGNVTFSIVEIR
jgi:hypothetical protein